MPAWEVDTLIEVWNAEQRGHQPTEEPDSDTPWAAPQLGI